ncbi:MAG TPA: hypothetical protein PLE10_00735 [Brevefilum sp.]|nr:hypothetical protein [Brevefilum sp.]
MAVDINLITEAQALDLWTDSPHKSVFTHPQVLSKLSLVVDWWQAVKGNQPQCIWPICKSTEKQVELPALTYYVGPLWMKDVFPLPAHRSLARTTEVYEQFIDRFITEYGAIEASLPKGLLDVRVFDWWNYHLKDQPRFRISPRYTACIENLQNKTDQQIIADFRQLRRRELRAIEKCPPPPRATQWENDDLIDLYLRVVDDQIDEIKEKNCRQIYALVDLVNLGFGDVIAFQSPEDERVIAACLLLYDQSEANMVLNLVNEDWRGTGLAAWMIKESIIAAKSKGMSTFDFNGANSPNRGDDKHSYGASPILYFDIKFPGENHLA